ncbi:MAG: hypothetical protein WCO84_01195 [bacterium]
MKDIKNKNEKIHYYWNKGDSRNPQWAKERKRYGFDERETWSLDHTFFIWLYERLQMYVECANYDMTQHVITIGDKTENLQTWISILLNDLRKTLNDEVDADFFDKSFEQNIVNIFKEIILYLWW